MIVILCTCKCLIKPISVKVQSLQIPLPCCAKSYVLTSRPGKISLGLCKQQPTGRGNGQLVLSAHGNRPAIWIDLASFCQLNSKAKNYMSTQKEIITIYILIYYIYTSNVYQAVSLMSRYIPTISKNHHESNIKSTHH